MLATGWPARSVLDAFRSGGWPGWVEGKGGAGAPSLTRKWLALAPSLFSAAGSFPQPGTE